MKNNWDWLWALLRDSPWEKKPHKVFDVISYFEMFCSTIALATALIVLIEIRKGPGFISRAVGAIITVTISILILNGGISLDWWEEPWTHPIGIFFFCLCEFMDIIIYFNFA